MSSDRVSRIGGYDDLRRLGRRRVPRGVFEFVEGGAGGEVTVRENRAAFERVRFEPRWLRDVSGREIATTVLGERLALPVGLAPAGLARLVHRDGELAAARAAGAAGTVFCVSIASSFSIEEIADAASGPLWLQLYLWKSEKVVAGLVERARAAGYRALVLTVDTPAVGNRERDVRNGASLPPRVRVDTALDALRRPRWLYDFARGSTITFANLRERRRLERRRRDRRVRRPRAERPERDVGAARLAAPPLGRAARGEGDPLSGRRPRSRPPRRRRGVRLEPRRPAARRLAGHARRAAPHRGGGRRPRRGPPRRRRAPRRRRRQGRRAGRPRVPRGAAVVHGARGGRAGRRRADARRDGARRRPDARARGRPADRRRRREDPLRTIVW